MQRTVAVIGANGKTGRAFVKAALGAGHRVRAGYHTSHTLKPHKNLTTLKCDALSQSDIETLLEGCDAVVSCIGHGSGSPARVQTDAIKTVAAAMYKQGITRLISLTGTGVRFPEDRPSVIDRLVSFMIEKIDPNRIRDGCEHAAYLQTTDLNWTIVRVLKLTDAKNADSAILTLHGPAEPFTPRARAAEAILQLLEDDTYTRQAPIISGHI